METIKKIWFAQNRIFIQTSKGQTLSRPLEAFPRLLEATQQERQAYKIGAFGDDIRWELIDEDIHIRSFFTQKEPNLNNSIARIFEQFPQLNVSAFAQSIGINKSLLSQYIYGTKTPSPQRKQQIQDELHKFADELKAVRL